MKRREQLVHLRDALAAIGFGMLALSNWEGIQMVDAKRPAANINADGRVWVSCGGAALFGWVCYIPVPNSLDWQPINRTYYLVVDDGKVRLAQAA